MTRNKRKKNSNKIQNYQNSILTVLKADRNNALNYKQIAAKLNVNDASSRNQIIKNLAKLASKGDIKEVDRGKFKVVVTSEYHTGKLDISSRGNGYITSEDFEEDVHISSNNINKALNGDEVEFYVFKRKFRGRFHPSEIAKLLKLKVSIETLTTNEFNINYLEAKLLSSYFGII